MLAVEKVAVSSIKNGNRLSVECEQFLIFLSDVQQCVTVDKSRLVHWS